MQKLTSTPLLLYTYSVYVRAGKPAHRPIQKTKGNQRFQAGTRKARSGLLEQERTEQKGIFVRPLWQPGRRSVFFFSCYSGFNI